MTACGPAAPSPSVLRSGSATPSPVSTPSLEPTSPTPTASPGWVSLVATTLPARLATGLSRAVAIVIADRIAMYGGFASTGLTTGEIVTFDPVTGQLSSVGMLAVPVHDAAGVALGDGVTVFGGGSGAPTAVVQHVDAQGLARVVGNLPTPRADLSAVAIGDSAFVLAGGASGLLPPEILASKDGVQFLVAGTLRTAVRYAAVAETEGVIYLIGGAGAAGETADIQRFDPTTGQVELIGQMPNPISHASAMVLDGRIFVVGGRSGGIAQDAIWQVDPVSGATRLAGHLPQAASDFALAVIGGAGYAIGGETDTPIATIVEIVVG